MPPNCSPKYLWLERGDIASNVQENLRSVLEGQTGVFFPTYSLHLQKESSENLKMSVKSLVLEECNINIGIVDQANSKSTRKELNSSVCYISLQ